MKKEEQTPVILALTGASGVQYALRLMECLLDAGTPIYLMVSKAAQIVLSMETELKVPAKSAEMERFFIELYRAEAGQDGLRRLLVAHTKLYLWWFVHVRQVL